MTSDIAPSQVTQETDAYIQRGRAMVAAETAQRSRMRAKKFSTIAVHGIYNMEAALASGGSINEPAYLSTSQHFENSAHMETALAYQMPSWTYTRIANPTVHFLEETLAMLEGYGYAGDVSATMTSSGMAAVHMATNPFLSQDGRGGAMNIVAGAKCYGGTFMLFAERYGKERGVEIRWVQDMLDVEAWARLVDENTRFVFGEMPSNPGLALFDIPAVAELAHSYSIPLIVDSTVATPALLRPICLGADIVVQSASKTLCSSGMAIAGAVIARHNLPSAVGPDEMQENFATYVKLYPLRDHGPGVDPFTSLMVLTDLRTLRDKVDRMSRNAQQVADFLDGHPAVERIFYPGLVHHPGHKLARRDMWLVDGEDDYGAPVNRYGHLLSFTVTGGVPAARAAFDRLEMIWRATDLGRIKSVATIPAISTHQQQGEGGRDLADLPPHLIRLNVGAEHPTDIIADLDQALG